MLLYFGTGKHMCATRRRIVRMEVVFQAPEMRREECRRSMFCSLPAVTARVVSFATLRETEAARSATGAKLRRGLMAVDLFEVGVAPCRHSEREPEPVGDAELTEDAGQVRLYRAFGNG